MSSKVQIQRQLRQIRLARLSGLSLPDAAARAGLSRSSAWRMIRAHGLDDPERPLERQRLSLSEAHDRIADRVADPATPAEELASLSGVLIRLAGETLEGASGERVRWVRF